MTFCGFHLLLVVLLLVVRCDAQGTVISVPPPATLANGGEDPGCTLTRSPVACNERVSKLIRCQWCDECNTCLWFCINCAFYRDNVGKPTLGVMTVVLTAVPGPVTTTTTTMMVPATTSMPKTIPSTTRGTLMTSAGTTARPTVDDKMRDRITPSPPTSTPLVAVETSRSSATLFTNAAPELDMTAVIIGAVVAGVVFCMLVVLVAALVYRRRKRNEEIAAIASTAIDAPVFGTTSLPSFTGAGLTVANKSFIGGPPNNLTLSSSMSFNLGPPPNNLALSSSMRSFNTGEISLSTGAFACPHCSNLYPSSADVAIHVQKRHGLHVSTANYNAGEFTTTEIASLGRPSLNAAETVRYDSSMPMSSSVEPANYRNLAPYTQQSDDRFAKFQN
jgi:hypothetical protein